MTMLSIIELIALIILLLFISTLMLAVSKKLTLPFSVALILAGMVLAKLYPASLSFFSYEWLPDVVLFIFLPTLIFEAAFKLQARPLRYTLFPIVVLGVLGTLLFATMVGFFIKLLTPLTFPEAFLLGMILSATDHSVLLNLFRRIDAPKRLMTLVEGESLFNNATAIVAANILFSLVVVGSFPLYTIWQEWETFVWQISGGILIGWITALITGYALQLLRNVVFIQVSTTIILVYGTFLIAEEWLQVSGIMATLAAGMTLSRFSSFFSFDLNEPHHPTSNNYLVQFWEYLAHITYTMIFLIAGLNFDVTSLTQVWRELGLVLLAVFFARPLIIYALMALISLFPHQKPISWRYCTAMHWGGLQGAVSLAIIFSLGDFAQGGNFLALVTGVVLLTVLTLGLSLSSLIRQLGLEKPSFINRLLRLEGMLEAQQRAFKRIAEFQQGGLFSARIAQQQRQHCETEIQNTRQRLTTLREQSLTQEEEYRLLFIRVFALEKALYQDMFVKGHLSERAYRNLIYSIEVQGETIRHEGQLPKFTLHFQNPFWVKKFVFWILTALPKGQHWVDRLQIRHAIRDYEESWGRYQGNVHVLNHLDHIAQQQDIRPQIIEKIRSHYRRWHESARARIDHTTEQFSELVTTTQQNLAQRFILHAQRETIVQQSVSGFLPVGLAQTLIEELETKFHQAHYAHGVPQESTHLLRKVPLFRHLSLEECTLKLVPHLKSRTVTPHEILVKQGECQHALFLIAYGVVRVSQLEHEQDKDIATLMAGDFFGEDTLFDHLTSPAATYRAVTSCSIYELHREDFEKIKSTLGKFSSHDE